MTKQAQIALLAAALEEVGKMPEWIEGHGGTFAICASGTAETVMRYDAVLAALYGVAYSYCAKNGVAPAPFFDKWTIPNAIGLYATEAEALASAVKIAKGDE